jgi:hypothetical protein
VPPLQAVDLGNAVHRQAVVVVAIEVAQPFVQQRGTQAKPALQIAPTAQRPAVDRLAERPSGIADHRNHCAA